MWTPAWLTRIGADPRDDEDLRQKKSLLVLLAILVLPVSIVWGTCYLAFGSAVGIIPFVYFTVSFGSLLVFARTRQFGPFLSMQFLDILLTTNLGQMFAGGFLPAGGSGCGGSSPHSERSCSSRCARRPAGSSGSCARSCCSASRARHEVKGKGEMETWYLIASR